MLLALLTALGPLSIDMYLPALPQMAQHYQVSTQMMANSLPAYFLGLAVGQLIYGPISDQIGRKKPLYFGMGLFAFSSLLCVFASDAGWLIAIRILQALGGCVGVVMARAAIRDRLDVQGSAQAFSSMMIVMGIAPIVAPILGAWILNFFNWQAIFIALVLIGLLCLFCVHFFFQETLAPERRLSLSTKQVFLLYMSILKDPSFVFPMLAGCLTGGALFSYISSASAVFMDVYQLDQQQFAYAFAFNAFGIILLSSLNKRLAGRLSVYRRLQIGGLIQFSGAVLIALCALISDVALTWIMLGLFMTVAGIGFTGPNAMALAMSKQGARAGTASALMGSAQFSCGLLGGIALYFMPWGALQNMGLLMLLFTGSGCWAIMIVSKRSLISTSTSA
ncbi:DHA1 family bicyclomycin/chloramphenicol resistance-like MFS transporter [Acinetobacter calcoaceticus]|uniref:Bcr/CflA family efflux transporter n=1 Tax=Acinetobacter calcoaceticus TaxID=471 RepID=A0A4R1XTS6_ACICA|nr:DHA1 family bicyclomycin/chloramphenicol resistance-like MFS transporter [Acinetobacter calcoaceticus]